MATGVFGDDTESSVLFSVQCTGNETEIMDCAHSTNGLETCSHHSAAIICQGLNYLTCCINLYKSRHFDGYEITNHQYTTQT